jgi:hypothetical protein
MRSPFREKVVGETDLFACGVTDKGKGECSIPRDRVHARTLQAQIMNTGMHACSRVHTQEAPASDRTLSARELKKGRVR